MRKFANQRTSLIDPLITLANKLDVYGEANNAVRACATYDLIKKLIYEEKISPYHFFR